MSETPPSPAPAPEPAPSPAPQNNPAPSPAPNPEPAPAPSPNPEPTPEPKPGDAPKEFKILDAYKDKPWAFKIKSEEDLYKQIDTLDQLKGKKHAYPGQDATPEELDKYFEGLRPESADKYNFGENHPNPEFAKNVGELLFNAGISEHQAKKIIPAYQAMEQAALEAATSADGFKAEMTKSFGEKYDAAVAGVTKEFSQHLTADDQKLIDAIPNQYLGVVYRLTAAMQKAYGVEDNGDAHAQNKSGQQQQTDWREEARAISEQIRQLETRPHTAQEKQDLINKRQSLYDVNVNKK